MNERISFVVLSCGLRETSMMVDYTERRKTERKKENVSPLHHRATTERRNIKRNKNETVFKFLLKYATMKFLITFFISFVVFGAVYRPSFMVDYTERRKTERKKFVNVSPLHHRPYNTERRSIKRKKN
jgi:hypothetical protein